MNKIDELIKQLKSDLGILPYSDLEQPEKFADMTMKDVEENIDEFVEILKDYLKSTKEKDFANKEKKI